MESSPEPASIETRDAAAGERPAVQTDPRVRRKRGNPKILRFRKSERIVHWAIAIPFLVCLSTATILVIVSSLSPPGPFRAAISWVHRISGVCFIVFPVLAVIKSRGDFRLHFYNIRQAWVWTLSDVRWLMLVGLAALNRKIALPEEGKFNAGEKLNFMVLMGTYPLYAATGLTIWLTDVAFLAWVVHFSVALMGAPLVIGHIYMATLNPASRRGLQGMISGFVDRQWAKHHYRRWYREHFEAEEGDGEDTSAREPAEPSMSIVCSACAEPFHASASGLSEIVPDEGPMTCPHCGYRITRLTMLPDPEELNHLLSGTFHRGHAMRMLAEALQDYDKTPRPGSEGLHMIGLGEKTDDNAVPGLRSVLARSRTEPA